MNIENNINFETNYYYAKIGSALKEVQSTVFRLGGATASCFYEISIFFAMDNQAIAHQQQKYKDLSTMQKVKIGIMQGVARVVAAVFIGTILIAVLSGMSEGRATSFGAPTLYMAVLAAVMEEILFRGIVQNCFAGLQKATIYIAPTCIKNNSIFVWITSPSVRMLIINGLFAAAHLRNAGGYLSTKGSIIQAVLIVLLPTMSTLHETTGTIVAPIFSHVTNNAIAAMMSRLLG